MELVEHFRRGHEDDALGGVTGAVSESASEKGLAGAGRADEERIDALIEEREVVEGEIARADLLAAGREVEAEAVDGVDLGKSRIVNAAFDSGASPALALLVGEAMEDVGGGEIFGGGLFEE